MRGDIPIHWLVRQIDSVWRAVTRYGLACAPKAFIEAHQGRLEIGDRIGQGTAA